MSSQVGQGTTFQIYLPEFVGAAPDAPAVPAPASPRGAETILIVEDEAAARRMASRALVAQGYSISRPRTAPRRSSCSRAPAARWTWC